MNPGNHLLGIAFGGDGHKRITRTDQGFTVVGGSAENHERMAEQAIKTSEALKRKGKTIETADPREVRELLHKHRTK